MGRIKESYNIQKHIRCYGGGLLCFRLHQLFPVTLFTLSRIATTFYGLVAICFLFARTPAKSIFC